MSRRGDGYDNAVMERFFSTVKSERANRFASFSEELFDYIEVFYNQRRAQIRPAAFERRAMAAYRRFAEGGAPVSRMVEAAGVEPASESTSSRESTCVSASDFSYSA